jgi:glycosyltransferase involved in cell wall biosynthesis
VSTAARPLDPVAADGIRRVTICCGDLAHPRKNVAAGVRAVGLLAQAGMSIELELVGGNAPVLAGVLDSLPASVRVVAPGRLVPEAVEARLMQTDLMLIPSLYEEWGYVVTEAVLLGTPVVAFPVYPFIEVLSPPLGRCAVDMGIGALADAMKATLEDHAGRAVVKAAAGLKFGAFAVGQRLDEIWSGGRPLRPEAPLANARG